MNDEVIRTVFEDRRIAYAVTDRNLKVVEVYDVLGLLAGGQSAWVGCSLYDLAPELIGSEAVLEDILTGELPRFQLEWVNRHAADGGTRYVTLIDLPHRDRQGKIVGVTHVVEDISEHGRLQQRIMQRRNELRLAQQELAASNLALSAANAELQHLDDMKSRFIQVAAHELRTPLAAIKGYTDWLLDGQIGVLTQRQLDSLTVIQNSADRLLAITNNLLDVTRIEAGRVDLILQPLYLADVLHMVLAELKPALEAAKQSVAIHETPDLPPALCDEVRIAQVLSNLLSNASKYTPSGGHIEIRLGLADEEGFLLIAVEDNGVGIPLADQECLFERFFRAENVYLTDAEGAGLGLHITRSLVELHGGRIWFSSQEGVGTTFFFTLPTAD